ncbi:serine protease [Xylella fastidiosa subsp. multiplex]|uniref:Serine protease n=1 Tax=Xylella fastidiosa subsp. multiplex TaxID=644357 RepID=A0AAW6HY57_XYLFS|nr:serine protease [Xylella fastidiosa]MDC6409007.1 serine protease [Xylella fastidiosa subsp. multiplex]MDD0935837.1 serine protease [Xylella fastidiosa subsp. multiplex]MSS69101.1 serine protease [Xylella fastidiosa subsp. multiplex]
MSQFQKNRFYFGNTVVFALLVLSSLGVQATPRDEVIVKSISEQEQRAALNYWTDERIEKTLAQNNDDFMYEPNRVDPSRGTEMMSTGRLFYILNGHNVFCTANAVESATKSVIATAAHCSKVPATKAGRVHIEHLVFLSHYRKGEWAGRFPVRNVFTVAGWDEREEGGFDFAFLSVAHDDYGSRVGDLVIASPIRFSPPPLLGNFYMYGYPIAIHRGEFPYKCSTDHPIEDPHSPSGPTLRIGFRCKDFSGGTSGGPVLQTLPDGTYQTGNVKGYIERGNAVAFTYWEAAAHSAWDRAQHDQ